MFKIFSKSARSGQKRLRLSECSRPRLPTKLTSKKEQAVSTPVWIDCDPGHDDAFALLLATHSPEIQLLGVSVVHGNDKVENCGLNAKRFLWTCGVSGIPVYLGAERPLMRNAKFCPEIHGVPGEQGVSGLCGFHFPDDEIFSNPEYKINEGHGVLKMMDCITKHPQKVTIVATGAQTNIALLLRMFPNVCQKIEKIVLMGGAIGLGNTSIAAEFNIEIDPEAAHIVFHSGIPLVMIPLEVTHTILVTDEILNQIKEINHCNKASTPITHTTQEQNSPHRHFEYEEIERLLSSATKKQATLQLKTEELKLEVDCKHDDAKMPVSPFLNCCYQLLIFFKSTYKEVFSFESPPLHDPCTIFYLTNPEAFQTIPVFVDVETASEKCYGRTLVDVHNILKKEPNVLICTRVNTGKFWERLFQCLEMVDKKSPLNKLLLKN